ncbi:alpha/beta-hydrolase [Panus rudis PR-1116 ss-1]|nr:alpha/beta-hydrolase [Panus rudis PR-1116 ss-1]
MAHSLQSESYVFDPRPRYPLVLTAKRYWNPIHYSEDPDALTLVFAHGTGFHKEHWEPTLQDLYQLVDKNGAERFKIREAWCIDCPNHGDAAILNEQELLWGYENVFGWEEYARGIHSFLTGQGQGVPVDFTSRNLVGIGHSMGAVAIMLSTTYLPTLKYHSIILVDPMMYPKPPSGFPPLATIDLAAGAIKRRDQWPSRSEALQFFQSRPSFKIWDPRVLEAFVNHGLRDLPTAVYPNDNEGVTLKCPRAQEAACYRDTLGRTRAFKYLHVLCDHFPVHFIYGGIDDYLPREVKDVVLEVAARGRYQSLARVSGAGHLVVQTHPNGLAIAIGDALESQTSAGIKTQSKL